MNAKTILDEIRPLGRASYKKVLMNHGVTEPCFGVKIEELKKIQKRIKKDHALALALFDTGVYDAMYLAGLIADESRMTRDDLQHWVEQACRALIGFTVAGVAADSPLAREMALTWIESEHEREAEAGWATLAGLVATRDDAKLDLPELKRLLLRVRQEIHRAPNYVRYQMNGFVIAAGCYVRALTEVALQIGTEIGPVSVDMGNTACTVPFAPDYIRKVEKRGAIGKKRKSARC